MFEHPLPIAYQELANKRASSCPNPYKQPEDFHYQFQDWVSPYTKGAHAYNSVAIVLQDWASSDALKNPSDNIQEFGRNPELRTNRNLSKFLKKHFNLEIPQTYATNIFPWVKPGGMSAPIPVKQAYSAAEQFTINELRLAQPIITIALGTLASQVLSRLSVHHFALPHPAARISREKADSLWEKAAREYARLKAARAEA